MTSYAFILGRKNLISLAELAAKLPEGANFETIVSDFAIISFPEPLKNPQQELDLIGGTIKIAEILETVEPKLAASQKKIFEILKDKFAGNQKKITYAVAINNFPQKPEIILKKILIGLKKELTAAGVKSRFINNNFQNPEIAQLKGEKITTEGLELTILNAGTKHYLAKTVAIQDIDFYSHRDYERPERNARLGMLPPKLAQILINLTGLHKIGEKKRNLIYDPFCGLGTVLMEGYLMGDEMLGSDLSRENIAKCRTNLKWVSELKDTKAKVTCFAGDATRLNSDILPSAQAQKIDAVVSETWLGPPVKICPLDTQLNQNFEQVEKIITGFLGNARELTKANTPIVFTILTYFRKPNRFIFPENLLKKINRQGYQIEPLFSKELIEKFHLDVPDQYRLIYSRPDQVVCRTILKLTRIK